MSFPFEPKQKPGQTPAPKHRNQARAALLGLATLLAGAGSAVADAGSSGSATVTLGFPHTQVSVSRTWGDGERVAVNDPDYDDEYVVEKRVIVRDEHCAPKKVVIVERIPERCDRDRDVRIIHETPRCDRRVVVVRPPAPRVVVIQSPAHRIVHRSHHPVIIDRRDYRHHDNGRHNGHGRDRIIVHDGKGSVGHDHRGDHGNSGGRGDNGNHGGNNGSDSGHGNGGSRDLFGHPSSDRPSRDRGVSHR